MAAHFDASTLRPPSPKRKRLAEHDVTSTTFPCPYPGCQKIFTGQDSLQQHREQHYSNFMLAPTSPQMANQNWSFSSYPLQTQTSGYGTTFFANTPTNSNSRDYTNNRHSCGCLCHIGYAIACNCSQLPCSSPGVNYQDMNQVAAPLPASPANSLADDLIELQHIQDNAAAADMEGDDLDDINPTLTFYGPIHG